MGQWPMHIVERGHFGQCSTESKFVKLWIIFITSIDVLLLFVCLLMKPRHDKFLLPNLISLNNYIIIICTFLIFSSQTLNYGIVQFII